MNKDYPVWLYKVPGATAHNDGVTFDATQISDAEAEQEARADGWAPLGEWLSGDSEDRGNQGDDPLPPRAELIARLKELGITPHHKAGDAKLAAMLKEAEGS